MISSSFCVKEKDDEYSELLKIRFCIRFFFDKNSEGKGRPKKCLYIGHMAESQLFYCFLQIFWLGSVFRMKLHNHRYLEVVDFGFCWILMCWIIIYSESCLPTNIGRKLDPKRYFFLDFDSLRKVVRTFNRIHGYANTHVYGEGNIV